MFSPKRAEAGINTPILDGSGNGFLQCGLGLGGLAEFERQEPLLDAEGLMAGLGFGGCIQPGEGFLALAFALQSTAIGEGLAGIARLGSVCASQYGDG